VRQATGDKGENGEEDGKRGAKTGRVTPVLVCDVERGEDCRQNE